MKRHPVFQHRIAKCTTSCTHYFFHDCNSCKSSSSTTLHNLLNFLVFYFSSRYDMLTWLSFFLCPAFQPGLIFAIVWALVVRFLFLSYAANSKPIFNCLISKFIYLTERRSKRLKSYIFVLFSRVVNPVAENSSEVPLGPILGVLRSGPATSSVNLHFNNLYCLLATIHLSIYPVSVSLFCLSHSFVHLLYFYKSFVHL